jgi:protein ImuB
MLRRVACIDIPDLPLQLLLRAHPDWRHGPAAVVAEEEPEAPLLLINRHARHMRLRTGMRFGAAKSLLPELRAGSVSALEVEETAGELVRGLQTFSPHVERDPVSAGVLYLDPRGLAHLYGGETSWARAVHRYLSARHFTSALVLGYGRALSYALARVTRGVHNVGSLNETLAQAREVPLERLQMTPGLRDALSRLGLSTLGDLASLGADQLALRFGAEAARFCRVAHGEEVLSLCPEPHADTPRRELEIDPPDDDVARLCFALKRTLDLLLEDVRQRGQSVRALWLRLTLLRGQEISQRLEPAVPTRDAKLLLELLRLRLSNFCAHAQPRTSTSTSTLTSPVVGVALEAELAELGRGQLSMFVPRRDLAAGARALARLKASFGEDVVCTAELADAHLPEAKFRWVSAVSLELPGAREPDPPASEQPLVRRFCKQPVPLGGRLEHEGREQVLMHAGERLTLTGPYRVSGGWWSREVARDYYYARAPAGPLWWVFFDAQRAGWFLQATVD